MSNLVYDILRIHISPGAIYSGDTLAHVIDEVIDHMRHSPIGEVEVVSTFGEAEEIYRTPGVDKEIRSRSETGAPSVKTNNRF